MVRENQVLIVVGETGCGKSTQLVQYLLEAGYSNAAKIGCTQPRRMAAKSVAEQVAKEMGSPIGGDDVGYQIRFESKVADRTSITFMTDGVLLNRFFVDPTLSTFSVIMLDEAHERSVNTDVLFALLKGVLSSRPDFKLILTSATLNIEKFSQYFNAPTLKIDGRAHAVDIKFSPRCLNLRDSINPSVSAVAEIHKKEPMGDILVFLPGQEEIEVACDLIHDNYMKEKKQYPADTANMVIYPCYSALPWEEQQRVFEPSAPNERKVVVATNIAETSLTIDGIVYVVDSGVMKQRDYNSKTGVGSLELIPITQAQAMQRAGRAGRTRPGKAFRMYREEDFKNMEVTPIPEIQRSPVEAVILQLTAMGIRDILTFEFMDPPSRDALKAGLLNLQV